MNEVKQQLAVANAQQLISTMNEKCYARCILKPAATLSPNDEGCISRCSDRFLEACSCRIPSRRTASQSLICHHSRSRLQDVHQAHTNRTRRRQYLKYPTLHQPAQSTTKYENEKRTTNLEIAKFRVLRRSEA